MRQPSRQQGVTLLIVLVIVALCTIIAAQLIEHGGYAERRTTLMLSRDQAFELALGGEALALKWLGQGFGNDERVHLNQPWATTPFDFPVEGGRITGEVVDAQSCFNLNAIAVESSGQSMVSGPSSNQPTRPDTPESDTSRQPVSAAQRLSTDPDFEIFVELVEEIIKELDGASVTPEELAAPVKDWIDNDIEPTGIDGAEDLLYTGYTVPYRTANGLMASKSELRMVKGFNAYIYAAIKDFICVLPDGNINQINVNTIDVEQPQLLAALDRNISFDAAEQLLQERPEDGYDQQSFQDRFPENKQPNFARIGFTSNYFLVKIQVELRGAVFRMNTLVKRTGTGAQSRFEYVTRYFGDF